MQDGKLIISDHPDQHYRTVFNQKTGFFVRKEDKGWPEPLWAMDGPELIDLSITNFCRRSCSFCYRRANSLEYKHLELNDVRTVVEQAAECGTIQIAIGGGNPNEHPDFAAILKLIREYDLVPTYTTNGDGLTDTVLGASADYCGAMALSVYAPYDLDYYGRILARIASYGVTINLHAIIHSNTMAMWTKWLKEPPDCFQYINAVIFLNYKPLHSPCDTDRDEDTVRSFFMAAEQCEFMKVGFDSCSISGIVNWMNTPSYLVESCEAARFSAFVSEDLKMYPCSFMVDSELYGDLRKERLLDIWQSNEFFQQCRQEAVPNRCRGCKHYSICKGGCKAFSDINFC